MAQLELVPGTLPVGVCFSGANALQQIYELFFKLGYAALPAGAGYSIKVSDVGTPPSADEQSTVVWVPLNGSSQPLGWFKYQGGAWLMPSTMGDHPEDERRIFVGSESDVWAYDGGDGTNPSAVVPTSTTGAMWEVDHTFDARFPLGAGTLAVSGTVVAVGATGGTDQTTITEAQLPAHHHEVTVEALNASGDGSGCLTGGKDDAISPRPDGTWTGDTEDTGSGSAFDKMPPYKAVYLIKRTVRRYYTPQDL